LYRRSVAVSFKEFNSTLKGSKQDSETGERHAERRRAGLQKRTRQVILRREAGGRAKYGGRKCSKQPKT
jgi:hypothetical protein